MKRFNEAGEYSLSEGISLVRMKKEQGAVIPKHSHPNEFIVFTCTKGKVEMTLDDKVEVVTSGETLTFDGNCMISGLFLEDSELVVTLVRK